MRALQRKNRLLASNVDILQHKISSDAKLRDAAEKQAMRKESANAAALADARAELAHKDMEVRSLLKHASGIFASLLLVQCDILACAVRRCCFAHCSTRRLDASTVLSVGQAADYSSEGRATQSRSGWCGFQACSTSARTRRG